MKKDTILIIDDEPDVVASLSFLLEDDYTVLTASNGKEGLSLIYQKQPSLVLLDLNMPEMNGVQFLQYARNARSDVPVMVITGNSSHDWAKKCADLNVQGYIEKPFDPETLLSRINRLLPLEQYEALNAIWGAEYDAKMSALSVPVKMALKYIQENYRKELTRDDVATHLGMSPQYLGRKFYQECGIHLRDYINILKVCQCKECLKDFDRKISEIGPEIGIPDANYLSRLFKKHTGLTPQEFRKKHFAP